MVLAIICRFGSFWPLNDGNQLPGYRFFSRYAVVIYFVFQDKNLVFQDKDFVFQDKDFVFQDKDAFWDFISLVPQTTHQVSFLFSDRGTPNGFR